MLDRVVVAPPSDPANPSICVVDDHALLREQVALMLQRQGFEVVATVGSCADGFHAVTTHRPFAAVIDNQLPDGRGVDLCRRLSVAVPSVRLVIHTGLFAPGLEEEAAAAGAWAVVGKSIRGTDLLAALGAGRSGPFDLR
jgi:DNA-binding NarL/FixJ family response regulator